MASFPAYVDLLASGGLEVRARRARETLSRCSLCGRRCEADRLAGADGAACGIGDLAWIDGYGAHHGEEDPLRGTGGSGTIFFSGCSLHCDYCQNWEISQARRGVPVTAQDLASTMIELQERGCHNVNLVSPTHVVPQILEALALAAPSGLRLPLVYNTGGYDTTEALELLDGIVDIYLPDMKYGDSESARRLSHVREYVPVNRAAVREMHRQVGDLVVDAHGVARRGLLVRHLVLPGGLAGTAEVTRFLADEISKDTYLNLLAQYRPSWRAWRVPPLDRGLLRHEYDTAVEIARAAGLRRVEAARSRLRLI